MKVIERLLYRPVNGMPREWQRADVDNDRGVGTMNKLVFLTRKVARESVKSLVSVKRFLEDQVVPVLPVLVVAGVLLYDRDNVAEMVDSGLKEVQKLPEHAQSSLRSSLSWQTRRVKNFLEQADGILADEQQPSPRRLQTQKQQRPAASDERVDMDALVQAQHQSPWNKVAVFVRRLFGKKR